MNQMGSGGRQPLLWAALAFAGGIFTGIHMWRPPVWWIVTAALFILFAILLLGRRGRVAKLVGLGAILAGGALAVQLRLPENLGGLDVLQFADGREITVTARVIREGTLVEEGEGEVRQQMDVETEQIILPDKTVKVVSGLRVSLYGKRGEDRPVRMFRYGERLRFPVKLHPPRNFRNPGAFDHQQYLADRGIVALGSVKTERLELLAGFSGNRAELWRTRIHRSIIEKVHSLWSPAQAGLVDAMVIGEDAFISRELRVDFQRSGTYHVLVVSGMNVGILAFVTCWVLRRLWVSDLVASAVTVLLAVAYALLTDVGAPIWRATLMLTLYLGARLLYREKSMLNAIGAAALGLLVLNPQVLFGASFQLTFLCVLLIVTVGVPLLERTSQPYHRGLMYLDSTRYDVPLSPKVTQFRLDLRMVAGRLERFVGARLPLPAMVRVLRIGFGGFEIFIISAVMQVGLALPMAYYFHRAAVVGMPANMLVVPLTGVLMAAAIAAVAAGYVSLALAKAPALIAAGALQAISGTVQGLGGLRVADTRVPTPEFVMVLIAVGALVLAMVMAGRRLLLAVAGLVSLTASAVWMCTVPPPLQFRHGVLEMTAIDVGQGDALLLVSPQGKTLLVDAGGLPYWMHSDFDIGEDVVSPYLWARGIHRLDAVAVTHAHSDHIGGMAAVLANFHPHELWLGVESPSAELQKLLEDAKNLGTVIVHRKAGDSFELGGSSVRILAPTVNPNRNSLRRNDDSLVMKISFGETSALLEGDAEKREEEIVAREQPQADLLKIAHHGSATSTIPELLAAVHPRFAVISSGVRNVYGHPRKEVLERLEQSKVATYRTDMDGAVTFYLDGKGVSAPVVH
jgi:competence protein ComEC